MPGDPARLAAGVLAGMGFLGAGVIMRHGNNIQGVTTASVLWLAAIIGLTIGGGYYILGAVSTILALLGLWLLPYLERRIKNYRQATLSVLGSAQLTYADLEQALASMDVRVQQVSIDRALHDATVRYELHIHFRDETGIKFPERVTRRMAELPEARQISWRQ
jgi:putative Mg2+ transporter-C (MgtC) family protein